MQSLRETEKEGTACLNCGTLAPASANFCPNCGQEKESRVIPLKKFFSNVLSEYLSVDNRFFGTMKLLVLRPGELTTLWWEGKRNSYIPPFRLYILLSIVYFSVLALTESNVFLMGTVKLDAESGLVFQKWLPRVLFVLMPLFAGALKVLNIYHDRFYIEHLVFAIHIYCFYFIVDILKTLFAYTIGYTGQNFSEIPVWASVLLVILAFLPLIYLGMAMKKAYPQPTWILLLKMLALMAGFVIIVAILVFTIIFYFIQQPDLQQ